MIPTVVAVGAVVGARVGAAAAEDRGEAARVDVGEKVDAGGVDAVWEGVEIWFANAAGLGEQALKI